MDYFYEKSKVLLPFIVLLFLNALRANAQSHRGNDTTYYIFFPGSITGRIFTSQKYTHFTMKNKNAPALQYKPNTTFNLGVGATYHNFTLNLAYGFGFVNHDQQKGKTKYLDLQGHFYLPKWVTDFEGQFYKGYHLSPKGFAANSGKYYYRGDVRVNLFGISEYRIFNYKRFSYRAPFMQNEWQKKSAGTFLAGAEVYYGVVKSDSSLIPQTLQQKYPQGNLNKINYFSIGPGIGYAYTLVLFHHIFFTGSLTGDLNFSFANEHLQMNSSPQFSVNPVTRFRVSAGYNSRSWNISANWIADNLPFKGEGDQLLYHFNTGNYRVIIAKKFSPGRHLKKHLHFLNKIFKE
ncbi:MAG: DUF4421 domain-containing protein [Ginsengibacter sp.]